MLLIQKRVYIAFMFVFLPVTAYSQVALYELDPGKTGFGFGLTTQEEGTTLGASIDYGIDERSKISFHGGIGFIDDDELKAFGGDIPPSPWGGISIVHVKPLGQSGLEYFFQGGFGAGYASVVEDSTNDRLASSQAFSLSGSGGLLKRLETESDWVIIPFFALSYANVWTTLESKRLAIEKTESDGSLGGTAGLEIEMSPTVSLRGTFEFSFESSDTAFSIGLNFH